MHSFKSPVARPAVAAFSVTAVIWNFETQAMRVNVATFLDDGTVQREAPVFLARASLDRRPASPGRAGEVAEVPVDQPASVDHYGEVAKVLTSSDDPQGALEDYLVSAGLVGGQE